MKALKKKKSLFHWFYIDFSGMKKKKEGIDLMVVYYLLFKIGL